MFIVLFVFCFNYFFVYMFQRNDTGEERKFEKKITVVRRLSNVSDAIVIYIIPLAVPLPFINTF